MQGYKRAQGLPTLPAFTACLLSTRASIYQQIRSFTFSRHCLSTLGNSWVIEKQLSSSVSVGGEVNYSYIIIPRPRRSRGLMSNLFPSLWTGKMNIFNPSCAIHRALRAREDSWLVSSSTALPANDVLPANRCRMGSALARKGPHKTACGRAQEPAGNKTAWQKHCKPWSPPKRLFPPCQATPLPAEPLCSWCSRDFTSARTSQCSRPKRLQQVPGDDTAGKSKHHPGGATGVLSFGSSSPSLPDQKQRVE